MKLSCKSITTEQSPIHGWGLFAGEHIPEGDVVLQSVVYKVPFGLNAPRSLMTYFYAYAGKSYLALGDASLINSSDIPNTEFAVDDTLGIVTITAIKDILAGEEITLKYL